MRALNNWPFVLALLFVLFLILKCFNFTHNKQIRNDIGGKNNIQTTFRGVHRDREIVSVWVFVQKILPNTNELMHTCMERIVSKRAFFSSNKMLISSCAAFKYERNTSDSCLVFCLLNKLSISVKILSLFQSAHSPVTVCVDFGVNQLFTQLLIVQFHLLHDQLHREHLTITITWCSK